MPKLKAYMARASGNTAIDHHGLPLVILPLVLLAVVTAYILFLSSDANVNALFTKCLPSQDTPATVLITDDTPSLARLPMVGIPMCCLVSFFHAALDSVRSFVIMNEILSYVGALLTVTTMESARACNQSSWMIRNPTPAWLLFNLAGGAVVWQLAIIPSFLSHEKGRRKTGRTAEVARPDENREPLLAGPRDPHPGDRASEEDEGTHMSRHLDPAEIPAISSGVALGYFVPCMPFLLVPGTASITAWLFFPAYTSVARIVTRRLAGWARNNTGDRVHPESSHAAIWTLYLLPIVWSAVAHWSLLYHLIFVSDDRSATTRAALGFIVADFSAIGLTVLWWIAAEAGWRLALFSLVVGIVIGPGGGLCAAWVLREEIMANHFSNMHVGKHKSY